MTALNQACTVIAPGLTPHKPGDKVKTDRRDAENLAQLHRAVQLTPVRVPTREENIMFQALRAGMVPIKTSVLELVAAGTHAPAVTTRPSKAGRVLLSMTRMSEADMRSSGARAGESVEVFPASSCRWSR